MKRFGIRKRTMLGTCALGQVMASTPGQSASTRTVFRAETPSAVTISTRPSFTIAPVPRGEPEGARTALPPPPPERPPDIIAPIEEDEEQRWEWSDIPGFGDDEEEPEAAPEPPATDYETPEQYAEPEAERAGLPWGIIGAGVGALALAFVALKPKKKGRRR